MKKIIIVGILLFICCKKPIKEIKQDNLEVDNTNLIKTTNNYKNNIIIDSFKLKNKIDWSLIPIIKLPISSKEIDSSLVLLKKHCCSPRCDKEFKIDPLDAIFSNNTEYITKSNHYDNGHPSKKQGYFGLRLPNMGSNKVLLYSYYDSEASDYKACTIEIQIFNIENELVDKKIIQDALFYECGWTRTFSILKDYTLKIKDRSYCVDIAEENGETFDEIEVNYLYKIVPTGKIKKISEKILKD